jgi:hypothetical protein
MMTPSPPVPSEDFFLSPKFAQTLVAELAVDAIFGPIMFSAAAALGQLVNCLGTPVASHGSACAAKGWTFLIRCGLLYRRGQSVTDHLVSQRVPSCDQALIMAC